MTAECVMVIILVVKIVQGYLMVIMKLIIVGLVMMNHAMTAYRIV